MPPANQAQPPRPHPFARRSDEPAPQSGPEPQGSPFNPPKPFEIEGRTFMVRMHTLIEREALDALIKEFAPSPIELLKRNAAALPPDIAKEVLLREFRAAHNETCAEWPPAFRTLAWWNGFLSDFEAHARLTHLALRSDPGAAKLSLEDVRAFIRAAYGNRDKDLAIGEALLQFIYGPPDEENPYDPKALWRAMTGLPDPQQTMSAAKLLNPVITLASAMSAGFSVNPTDGPDPTPSEE